MLKYYPGDRIILRRGLSEKKQSFCTEAAKTRGSTKDKIIIGDEKSSLPDVHAYWLMYWKPCTERTRSLGYDYFPHFPIDIVKTFHELPPMVNNGEVQVMRRGNLCPQWLFGRAHTAMELKKEAYKTTASIPFRNPSPPYERHTQVIPRSFTPVPDTPATR